MNTCRPSCVENMPSLGDRLDCNISTRKGGIPFLLFYKCDPDAEFAIDTGEDSPWSSLENIRQAICQENLYATGELLGSKPKGTSTKKRFSSCSPEETVSGVKTLNFQDYNADNDNLVDFEFWPAVVANKKFLQVGWVTCDDLLYMSSSPFDIDVDPVIEDNSESGYTFWDGVISINQVSIIVPIKVVGIYDLLKNLSTAVCYG